METGVLLGRELQLEEDERAALVREAAELGYTSAWTNSGPDLAGVESCQRWFEETGLKTGVAVVPTPGMDLEPLARASRKLGEASKGRFILGIGSGRVGSPDWRAKRGLGDVSPLALMREHITYLQRAAGVPVYLGSLGPLMIELTGEIADGLLPNWMDPSQLRWARERVARGAKKVGRDPAGIEVAQSIRIAVDDDRELAKGALTRAALGYVMGRPELPGGGPYRQAMTRMGLDEEISRLEAMRDTGSSEDEIVEAFPEPALRRLGAWGPAEEAVAQLQALAEGLDTTIVRVVAARKGVESVRAVIRACAPNLAK